MQDMDLADKEARKKELNAVLEILNKRNGRLLPVCKISG